MAEQFKTINARASDYAALRRIMSDRQLGTIANALHVVLAEAIVAIRQKKKQ